MSFLDNQRGAEAPPPFVDYGRHERDARVLSQAATRPLSRAGLQIHVSRSAEEMGNTAALPPPSAEEGGPRKGVGRGERRCRTRLRPSCRSRPFRKPGSPLPTPADAGATLPRRGGRETRLGLALALIRQQYVNLLACPGKGWVEGSSLSGEVASLILSLSRTGGGTGTFRGHAQTTATVKRGLGRSSPGGRSPRITEPERSAPC